MIIVEMEKKERLSENKKKRKNWKIKKRGKGTRDNVNEE